MQYSTEKLHLNWHLYPQLYVGNLDFDRYVWYGTPDISYRKKWIVTDNAKLIISDFALALWGIKSSIGISLNYILESPKQILNFIKI